MGIKDKLATALYGRFSPLRPAFEAFKTGRLIVLAYHRINEIPGPSYPYQDETVSATPEMFREQLAFLKKRCFVTTFVDLAEMLDAGEKIPKNTVIITFDDGYRDNFDIALPLLSEYGLPAVVYLVSDNLDSGKPFWFDQLSYCAMRAPNGKLKVLGDRHSYTVETGNRKQLRRQLGDLVRTLDDAGRLEVLDELLVYSRCQDRLVSEDRMVMTWSEASQLHAAGIELGSHTVSHPFLSRLTDQQIASELSDSKRRIEAKTGANVVSLAYPTGGAEFYDKRVIESARTSGYRFAVSYIHDAKPYTEDIQFEIPRIHVELDVSQPLFSAYSLLPGVFLKSLARAAT